MAVKPAAFTTNMSGSEQSNDNNFGTVHVLEIRICLERDQRLDAFVVFAPRGKHQRCLHPVALPASRIRIDSRDAIDHNYELCP